MSIRKMTVFAAILLLVFAGAAFLRAQDVETDVEGGKDHPLVSRMTNFFIVDYLARFDEHEFYVSDEETKMVEGDLTSIDYQLKEGAPQPSPLQIRRNYSNALKTIGATLVHETDEYACWKLVKGGEETWIDLSVHDDGWSYELNFVRIAAMIQEVSADEMREALDKAGFIALYINFESIRSSPCSRKTRTSR